MSLICIMKNQNTKYVIINEIILFNVNVIKTNKKNTVNNGK